MCKFNDVNKLFVKHQVVTIEINSVLTIDGEEVVKNTIIIHEKDTYSVDEIITYNHYSGKSVTHRIVDR